MSRYPKEIKGAEYRIRQAPVEVTWECPYCGWEMDEEWEEFTSRTDDEYDVWTGRPDMTGKCAECGKEFEFRGVDID